MNQTARLIQWQRLTIATLLLALIVTGCYAGRQLRLRRVHVGQIRLLLRELNRGTEAIRRASAELDRRDRVRRNDQRTIQDLKERLRRYEAKHGETDTIVMQGLKPLVDR